MFQLHCSEVSTSAGRYIEGFLENDMNKTTRVWTSILAVGVMVLGAGCANDTGTGALIGAGVGAVGGAVIGNNMGGHGATGALIGAGVGGLGGAAIGNASDQHKKERSRAYESGYGEGRRDGYDDSRYNDRRDEHYTPPTRYRDNDGNRYPR